MQKYSEIVATTKADGTIEVLPGATVTVYLTGTTTRASLYSDNGITAKANPFQSAALTGRIEFYAADGRYDIKIDKVGYTTVTVADILIEDPEDIGVLEDVTLVDATISTSTVTNSTLSQCILVNTTIQDVDSLRFTDTPDALTPRRMAWNIDEGTLDVALDSDTTLQMGQELHYRARNNTASTIADGAVVWATGTTGATGRINVGLAVADGSQPGKTVMGLVTHATAAGTDGYVAAFGKVRGINTTGSDVGETWLNGDILYLHPTIPGALTKVKPAVNGHSVVTVAIVVYAGNNGTLFVRPTADSQEADEIRYTPAGTGAVATTVQAKLLESVSVKDFGATGDGVTDDTASVNKAITHLAVNGGGTVRGIAGATSYIAGTIIVPSNVTLDFGAYTLRGTGSNTLIESGYVSGLSVVSNVSEYGVSGDGSGTHFVQNGIIKGVVLTNAAVGMRLHRFNYGCIVDGCTFAASLTTRSVVVTHSWSFSFINNFVGRLARFQDFVDWTTIQGNSFELTGTTALSIGTGGYGGSYSCRIVQNGFHGNQTAIQVVTECYNLEISSNHFENNNTAIDGDSLTKSNWSIHNNWIKANLFAPGACVGIQSSYLANSRVFNNTFTTDGSSTFSSIITLNSTDIFGVEVDVPYLVTPTGTMPSGYNLANTVLVRKLMGTNNALNSQPQLEQFAGSGSYTFEKYIAKYNFVPNTIPLCTLSNNGAGTYYVDTFVACDAYGVRTPIMFDILIAGAATYICMGIVGRFDIMNIVNKELFSGGAGLTVTASNNGGKLRLTFAGASAVANVSGFVKAM